MGLSDIKTEGNIQKAYVTEMQAKTTYLAYSAIAEAEGLPQVAKLFRAVAASEEVHAYALLKALRETSKASVDLLEAERQDSGASRGTTPENLKAAINAETDLFATLYLRMIQDADLDGWSAVRQALSHVITIEKVHAALFKEALDQLGRNETAEYYLCEGCGNTIERRPIGPCEVCDAPQVSFHMVR